MGFDKSFIYQLAPMVAKKMGHYENPVVVLVSSLIALMEYQVKEATLILFYDFQCACIQLCLSLTKPA